MCFHMGEHDEYLTRVHFLILRSAVPKKNLLSCNRFLTFSLLYFLNIKQPASLSSLLL